MNKNYDKFDQSSIISHRKSSRLSNFNPIKNRKPDFQSAPAINGSNSSYYNQLSSLTPTMTNSSDQSSLNGANYHLTKMQTNESLDSNYSVQAQFKIELNLNKREIEIIRYTWNKMLLDEPISQSHNNLAIPGGFNFSNQSFQSSTQSANNNVSGNTQSTSASPTMAPPKSASTIASSLFCRQFYSNLLAMDGDLEKLFPSIKHQAVAFAGVMSFTISQLENLSVLDDYLENLGKRHSRILGIEPSMFELMGEALIQTFHERFGNKFNQDLEILWIKLYLYLSNSLLQFGIDPILKLNRHDSSTENSINTINNSNIFKLNEVGNDYSSSVTTSSISTLNSKNINNDLFVLEEKKISTGLKDKKLDAKKKKKRDCVIQ